jgi:hypothetical protein
MISLDQSSPSVGRDLNPGFSGYESGALTTEPRRVVIFNAFGHDCTAESYTISPWFTWLPDFGWLAWQPKQVGYLHDSDRSHVANKLFLLIVERVFSLRVDHGCQCHGGTGVASVLYGVYTDVSIICTDVYICPIYFSDVYTNVY